MDISFARCSLSQCNGLACYVGSLARATSTGLEDYVLVCNERLLHFELHIRQFEPSSAYRILQRAWRRRVVCPE